MIKSHVDHSCPRDSESERQYPSVLGGDSERIQHVEAELEGSREQESDQSP